MARRGRSDHDHVADDEGRRVEADLAVFHRRSVEPVVDPVVEIDHALVAEVRDRVAGRGVERDEVVALGDVDDAVVALAVGPVGHPAARAGPHRRDVPALALVEAVHPQRLAGGPVDRHHVTPPAGGRVEHAVHRQGGRLVVEVEALAEVVRPPAPRDLEVGDVVAVDLVERGVLRAADVAPVVAPLTVLRPLLRRGGDARSEPDGYDDRNAPHAPIHLCRHVVLLFSLAA